MDALRFVTATSLFDGHDASINIFRRLLQARGVEVIHLGHNRSVDEIVDAAVSEDAHAVAVTSYQGGHLEFFRYLRERLTESGATGVAVFGGGGGTILPDEIAALRDEGTAHLYSPDDGRTMGLEGMVDDMITRSTRHERELTGAQVAVLDRDEPLREVLRCHRWHGPSGGVALDPRDRDHGNGRSRQILVDRRAGEETRAWRPRAHDRRAVGRSHQASERRRTARRPDSDECASEPSGLYAFHGDEGFQHRGVGGDRGFHRPVQARRVRSGDRRDIGDRTVRLDLRHDTRVRGGHAIGEDRHDRSRRCRRDQQGGSAGCRRRPQGRTQAVPPKPQPVWHCRLRAAGVQDGRRPVQRPGHDRSVPPHRLRVPRRRRPGRSHRRGADHRRRAVIATPLSLGGRQRAQRRASPDC